MFDYAIALERSLRYSFASAFDELIDLVVGNVRMFRSSFSDYHNWFDTSVSSRAHGHGQSLHHRICDGHITLYHSQLSLHSVDDTCACHRRESCTGVSPYNVLNSHYTWVVSVRVDVGPLTALATDRCRSWREVRHHQTGPTWEWLENTG